MFLKSVGQSLGIGALFATLSAGVPGCPPEPGPTPTPTPTATPTPAPTPTPSGGDINQGVEWRMVSPRPSAQFADTVNTTMALLTECLPQSRCILQEPMFDFFDRVVFGLRAQGLFAGVQPGADEICVGAIPNVCQGYHIYTCSANCERGTVGWAPGSARDTWISGPTPTPTPTPVPAADCPDVERIDLKAVTLARTVVDMTPKAGTRERCISIGKLQDKCPLGPEGTPEKDAQRMACEAKAGPYAWSINSQPCPNSDCFPVNEGNAHQFVIKRNGSVRVTAKNGVSGEIQVVLP